MITEHHYMDPRRAGLVARYHTWPHIKPQSVAEHTWQVMRVLWAIWPEVPRHVLQHALGHDCGELRVGDVPYAAKRMLAGMEEAFDRAEHDAWLSMCVPWGLPPPVNLSIQEQTVFKLAELIEMWEYGLGEVNLGNRYAALVVSRCLEAIQALTATDGTLPPGVLSKAIWYVNKRRKWEEEIHAD